MRYDLRILNVLAILALAGTACTESPSSTVDVLTSLQFADSTGEVSSVQVTVSAPDMKARVVPLAKEGTRWSAVVEALPAGSGWTFLGEAFNAAGDKLHEGTASGLTLPGEVKTAALFLRLDPPDVPPASSSGPVITSLWVSPAIVVHGEHLELAATVRGSSAGGALTSAWTSSPEGTFSHPDALETSWTTAVPQPEKLSLTVTEAPGVASTLSVMLPVRSSGGPADVRFNASPAVSAEQLSPTTVGVGEAVSVSVSASDLDGDALSYSWVAGCVGRWEGSTSASARFTPTVQLPVDTCARCPLTVTISDEYGGQIQRTMDTCVKPGRSAPPAMAAALHSLLIRPDGTVWAWGNNEDGQLGTGSNALYQSVPVEVPGLTGITTVAAGAYHSLALRSDGVLFAWGDNAQGQLGVGSKSNRGTPTQVPSLSQVVAIAAGTFSSLAVLEDGTVWKWGSGSTAPVKVPSLSDIVAVASGGFHDLALRSDGALFAWGSNSVGAVGDGSNTNRVTPVQVTSLSNVVAIAAGQVHSLALRSDGTVFAWGSNIFGGLGESVDQPGRNTPKQIASLSQVIAISAGHSRSAALRADGAVFDWHAGRTVSTQVASLTDVSAIAAGSHGLALDADGALHSWGNNAMGQLGDGTAGPFLLPQQVPGLSNIIAIAANSESSFAVRSDGGVLSWGGPQSVPAPVAVDSLANISAVSAGGSHALALRTDGALFAWGSNNEGQLGNGSNSGSYSPVQLSSLSQVSAVAAGLAYTLALRADGAVFSWGMNSAGELGDGSNTNRNTPLQLSALSNVSAIAAGHIHALAARADGALFAWGSNEGGQLGDGSFTSRNSPVQISGLSSVSAVAAGRSHSLAVRTDGTLLAWGNNAQGQLGDGSNTNRATPVQISGLSSVSAIKAGWFHSLAVRSDGALFAWGSNRGGQLGDGSVENRVTPVQVSTLSNVAAVATGDSHTLALLKDGTVWSWGSNIHGELGLGVPSQRETPGRVLLP